MPDETQIFLYIVYILGFLITCRFFVNFTTTKQTAITYLIFCSLKLGETVLFESSETEGLLLASTVSFVSTFLFCHIYLKQERCTSIFLCLCQRIAFAISNALITVVDCLVPISQKVDGFLISVFFSLVILFLSGIFLEVIVRRYNNRKDWGGKYAVLYTVPLLYILFTLNIIENHSYGTVTLIDGRMDYGATFSQNIETLWLLFISVVSCYLTFYAYEKVTQQVETEQKISILEVYTDLQKQYIEESKQKYDKTQSFRHDTNNHLTILYGLLEKNENQKARDYLGRLVSENKAISMKYSTGNPVIDVLFMEKFSFCEEQGIKVTCDTKIPPNTKIDDFDLCIIFFNALDNAIKGCKNAENPYIDLVAKQNKSFFIIDLINPYSEYEKGSGIGLRTIQFLVDKYDGSIDMSREDGVFRVSILFSLE